MLLTDLPPDLITLIATWVPIRTLRPVVRFDARIVACTRLQRWYRSSREGWNKSSAPVCVGDRVLVRLNSQSSIYATAAAFIDGPMPSWKLQKLDNSYVQVPVGQVRRLGEWADGPWADTTGRSAALASASAAMSAAKQATSVALAAMRSGVSLAESSLVIASATMASTAAAAATAASSAASPTAADSRHAQEAVELLWSAQQMQDAISHDAPRCRPMYPVEADAASALLAQAASAAATAGAEAAAAVSAAEAVQSVGTLPVSASAAAAVSSAAGQVATAVLGLVQGCVSNVDGRPLCSWCTAHVPRWTIRRLQAHPSRRPCSSVACLGPTSSPKDAPACPPLLRQRNGLWSHFLCRREIKSRLLHRSLKELQSRRMAPRSK